MSFYNLILISHVDNTIKKINLLSQEFSYNSKIYKEIDLLYEESERETIESDITILSAENFPSQEEISGAIQTIKQIIPKTYILVIVKKTLEEEQLAFIKKSGANSLLVENELYQTCKLEFTITQKIHKLYVPVKASEFKINSKTNFIVWHLLPQNRKFLPIIHAKDSINEKKMIKVEQFGEVYIKRNDATKFLEYVKENIENSQEGLKSRCRAQFLSLTSSYIDLVLLLTDRSERASYEKGKNLYETVYNLSKELIISLGTVGNAWDIINNSSVDCFGHLERSPAIASYAALYSLINNIGVPEEVLMSALMADIGMLYMDPDSTKKINSNHFSQLSEDELHNYYVHPIKSINLLLERKLQIPQKIRNIIQNTHERIDRNGFPKKPLPEKIPLESQLIQFSEILDQACALKMGQKRLNFEEIRKKILKEEIEKNNKFSFSFLKTMENN